MHLTLYSDYSLRVLMYVGINRDRLCTISEIADAYDISRNHLMKVVKDLGQAGYLDTLRGRSGGIRLAREPHDINIGQLVRHTEEGFELVECFGTGNLCAISPACRLRGLLGNALNAFLGVLDEASLADLLENDDALARLLGTAQGDG
jgi:Rrf2 family nitric oxide-sensitive transcriptional repressor